MKMKVTVSDSEQPTARKFTKALANATNRTVITLVPFK